MISLDSEAKEALKNGTAIYKHFEITMPSVFSGSINQYLIKESVHFSERMCSTDSLEFGLCEANGIEFEYFDLPPVAIGARIYVQYNFTVHGHSGFYEIPIGYFIVKSCTKNLKIGSYKVSAYNKLADAKFNENVHYILTEYFSDMFAEKYITVRTVKEKLYDYLDIDLPDLQMITEYYDSNVSGNNDACKIFIDPTGQQTWSSLYYFRFTETINTRSPINPYMAGVRFDYSYRDVILGLQYWGVWYRLKKDRFYKITIDERLTKWNENAKTFLYNAISTSKLKLYSRENEEGYPTTDADIILSKFYDNYKKEAMLDDPTIQIQGAYSGLTHVSFGLSSRESYYYRDGDFIYTNDEDAQINKGTLEDLSGNIITGVEWVQLNIPMYLYQYPLDDAPPSIVYTEGVMKFMNVDFSNIHNYPSSNTHLSESYKYYDQWDQLVNGTYNLPVDNNGNVLYDNRTFLNSLITVEEVYLPQLSDIDKLNISMDGLKSVPAREFLASEYELDCTFGIVDRATDEFVKRELSYDALFPSASLYPANNLYPDKDYELSADHIQKTQYEKLWIEPGLVKKFRTLYADYCRIQKNGEQRILTKTKTINSSANGGNVDYYMDNEILTNAENITDELIQSIVDNMYNKMKNLSWVPFELRCVGLPYLEVGDKIEINDGQETRVTYILQRELKGILDMHDEIINGNLDIY